MMRIGMNRPDLYHSSNNLHKLTSFNDLKKYTDRIQWRDGDSALDIGSCDGSLTTLIKNYKPYKDHYYTKFVGCDVNENMVNYAKQQCVNENITFRVYNIEDDLPEDMVAGFNHVFSFLTLHWVKDQEKAFRNIYNTLSDDGDIYITFIASTPLYTVYKALSKQSKWQTWLKNVDIFVGPYHDEEGTKEIVTNILRKCCFKTIDVQVDSELSVYRDEQHLNTLIQSVEPFNMPQEVFDEFIKDFCSCAMELGVINYNDLDDDNESIVTYKHNLIKIFATK